MLLQLSPNQSVFSALVEGRREKRQKQLQQITEEVDPQALNDTAQSLNDPHNQEGRPLTPERLEAQGLAESGFADTLFSIAGKPQAVAAPEDISPGLQGAFHTGRDSVAIQTNVPTSLSKPQILSHELGHRLFRTLADRNFREEFESAVDSVRLGRGQEIIDSFFLTDDATVDPSEAFAESFRAGLNTLRKSAESPESFEGVLQGEAASARRILGQRDVSAEEMQEKTRAVVDLLLEQPLFENHPLNRLREVEEVSEDADAARDVTRTENE